MDCIFCKIINGEIPSNVLYEDKKYLAILDLDQSYLAHCIIFPKEHIEDYTMLSGENLKEMFEIAKNVSQKIIEVFSISGVSFTFNYGSLQEIKHVHLHILPDKENENHLDIQEIYAKLKDED